MHPLICFFMLLASSPSQEGQELRWVGNLGNSGGPGSSRATFSEKPACGMGPVLDGQKTIWERGGSTQLNRYALDGRLLATYPLPDANDRFKDQLTLAGDLLVLRLNKALYRLPVSSKSGTAPERMKGGAEVLSSSSFGGRVAIYDAGRLFWLDPKSGTRTAIAQPESAPRSVFVDEAGVLFGFGHDQVHAWKSSRPVDGFPRPFRGARPQKIGSYWYAHADHGTIFRYSAEFEPDPGVVSGGASGSFIGYLPRSVDITRGTGLVHVEGDVFAVTGYEGVVQLLKWREKETQFDPVRRLGPLHGLKSLALDAEGNIWTPRGSWRWNASAETPLSLGDVGASETTQPVVVNGKALSFIKKHYSYVLRANGPAMDENGWAHMKTRGVKGIAFDGRPKGAASYIDPQGKARLLVTKPDGHAVVYPLSDNGEIAENPSSTLRLPGVKEVTSLATFEGRLLAADQGTVVVFEQKDKGWVEISRLADFGSVVHIHGDGRRFVVGDKEKGRILVYGSLQNGARPIVYGNLKAPTLVAIHGDRVVAYESGAERLVKLEVVASRRVNPSPPPVEVPVPDEKTAFRDVEYVDIGHEGGIPVAVAVREEGGRLHVSLNVPRGASEVVIGIAHDKGVFIVKGSQAIVPAGDPSTLRLAVRVRRGHQGERIGFDDRLPIHAPFSKNPADWGSFNLTRYREQVVERREQIRIEFDQPVDGKATLVVEDSSGKRVRNLVSGRSFGAGKQTVVWDGLDENGRLVPPGTYSWRGVTHPGIKPEFRMTFAGGREPVKARPWGPNHSLLHDAVSDGKHVYFAAPVTEGGWALMALDAQGRFVQGYEHQHGFGIEHDAIAVDDQYLYCAQDGFIWGGHHGIDWKSDRWTARWNLTVVRYDLKSGRMVEFPGKKRAFVADVLEVGPGSPHRDLKSFNLGGLAVAGGEIYVGSRARKAVLVFEAGSGKRVESIPLEGVRHLASSGATVYAATDTGIYRLKDGKRLVEAGAMDLTGLALGPDGSFWISDGASHQVHRFTAAGERVETLGKPGGPYKGAYDPDRMVHPAGLTLGPEGKLWVTEKRWNPKRVLAWDLKKKTVVYEKFGMPHYGGDGSGFDPENARRWIGLGCFWDVDLDSGESRPTHILSLEEAHFTGYHPQGYSFFREAGRTFLCTRGKIALILEVKKDGTLREIAAATDTHHFAYGCNWKPPQAYIDAFYAKWPHKRKEERPGRGGEGMPWAKRVAGVLWVDRNGDGRTQKEEFSFSEEGVQFGGGAWGHRQDSLTFRLPAAVGGQVKIVEIKPKGILPNGIPDYPALGEALKGGATDISLTPGHKRHAVSTARDRFGRFVFNSDPELNAYDAKGRHLWSYPNRWSNVHGSHNAPLPETGVLQGSMALLGMAPFDDRSDVFFINGNHGRCYLLTSDGLYLDEAFTDVRVSYLQNEYRLGGEIFGGMFDRSRSDGKYYVQIGHGPYRIYELHGIDKARRIEGSLVVTKEQIAAAERQKLRMIAQKKAARTFALPGEVAWDRSGKFKVALAARIEGEALRLTYQVEDPSPWINNGRDWTSLFATGDTVDLQIGVDGGADPKRRSPVEGDQRLLIAPYEGKPIAVLYQHRKPGGSHPIQFTSPWRGEKVDHVERLSGVAIEVKTTTRGYVVDARIPLTSMGLTPSSQKLRADFGVTFGNAEGTETQLRSYWANPATMLVDDIPGEIMLHPNLWGVVQFDR